MYSWNYAPLSSSQVDFLRRRIERLQREKKTENTLEAQLAAAREIINRLEDRLTGALVRLGNVENTTRTLEKRSVVSHFPDLLGPSVAAAARPPTLTVYPATHPGNFGLLETNELQRFILW